MIAKALGIPAKFLRLVLDLIIVYAPGVAGSNLRYRYYRKKFRSMGSSVVIEPGVIISGHEYISVGSNVIIDKYCVINAGPLRAGKIQRKPNPDYTSAEGDLQIGSNIHIAPFSLIAAQGGISIEDYVGVSSGSKIYSATNTPHDPDFPEKKISVLPLGHNNAPFLVSPVVIKENAWLGLQCIVMPGAVIGRDSFAVSNTLLMGRYEDNSYIAGLPGKKIKERFKHE